jgi:hypothetical protein
MIKNGNKNKTKSTNYCFLKTTIVEYKGGGSEKGKPKKEGISIDNLKLGGGGRELKVFAISWVLPILYYKHCLRGCWRFGECSRQKVMAVKKIKKNTLELCYLGIRVCN